MKGNPSFYSFTEGCIFEGDLLREALLYYFRPEFGKNVAGNDTENWQSWHQNHDFIQDFGTPSGIINFSTSLSIEKCRLMI
jgi:hypothetical protein